MKKIFVLIAVVASLFIIGCDGDQGETGAAGIMGPSPICMGTADDPQSCKGDTGAKGAKGEIGPGGKSYDAEKLIKYHDALLAATGLKEDEDKICLALPESTDPEKLKKTTCYTEAKTKFDAANTEALRVLNQNS